MLALSFIALIALGSGLLLLPAAASSGQSAPWVTAIFTAASAACVTGLAVVDTGTYWSPFGQAVILALFQLGGFGIMTFATLLGLLVNRQLGLRTKLLLQAETHSVGLGDVKNIAKLVLLITVVVETAATLVMTLRLHFAYDIPWALALWEGFFHAVAAFNNAGFSIRSNSVMDFAADAWILLPLMLAIVIGGLGFPVLHEVVTGLRKRQTKSIHTVLTLWGTGVLIVAGTVVVLAAEAGNPATLGPLDGSNKILSAAFTSISARSAGFNAIDTGSLTLESLNLHYLLMFIGGGSAGTAGGVKVTTFFVLLLIVWNEIRGHQDVEFRQRRISNAVQRQALSILVLAAGTVVVATMLIVPMTRLPYEKVLFEVISAFSTVGLSTGITAQLPPAAQGILVVLMFTGRVGVVTIAAAMAVNHLRRGYRYPEEKPIVG